MHKNINTEKDSQVDIVENNLGKKVGGPENYELFDDV